MSSSSRSSASTIVSSNPVEAPATAQGAAPGYIVVFREPSERNLPVLEKHLKLKEARGMAPRAGCVQFQAKAPGHQGPRLYQRLGVAVADLQGSEVQRMLQSEQVVAVVRNRVRTIPKPPETAAITGKERPFVNLIPSQVPDNPVAAYLTGIRDGADFALRALNQEVTMPEASRQVLAAPTPTIAWHLRSVGITSRSPTGKGVKVAVLDTGIDLNHPDFRGAMMEGTNVMSFVSGESAQDGHGHGTHCAGLVAGPLRPATGPRYGVAPDAELLIGKVLSNAGRGTDDQILDAIDWAADLGARIISMSLGSERFPGEEFTAPYEVIAKALLNSNPGVLLVAAAGNESSRPQYTMPVGNPAACPSILSVAAVDQSRRVAWFSCRKMDSIGSVDISAPGVAVHSSFAGGGYRLLSGTSMATPIVAGVAALVLEGDRKRRARALWKTLVTSASLLGDANDFGAGLVQAPVIKKPTKPKGVSMVPAHRAQVLQVRRSIRP